MAILKLNNNSLTNVTELPSGVGSDPNTKVSLARLGLRVFANQNLATSNTQNLSYDVFQDSTGITALTNCERNQGEFLSSVVPSGFAIDNSGTLLTNLHNVHNFDNNKTDNYQGNMVLSDSDVAPTFSSTYKKFGTHSVYSAGDNQGYSMNYNSTGHSNFAQNESTSMSCWIYQTSDNAQWNMIYDGISSTGNHGFIFAGRYQNQDDTGIYDSNGWANGGGTIVLNQWHHFVFMISTSKKEMYFDGVRQINASGSFSWNASDSSHRLFKRYDNGANLHFNGYCDQLCFWKNKILSTTEIADLYNSGNGNEFTSGIENATGSFEGVDVTAPSSVSKMGAVITYEETGTNVLNTDIVMKLSADSGSNFTTATLEALPDFASGVKCAKISNVSVTPGTACTYQLNFANQSTSKFAKITGVALTF